ncbi:MAG: phosphodiester glycosidase family protein [Hyphomonadaceae bacterium]|nr:phosphodiester glycosidase family protein [Clostridia bacterium]
MKITINQNLARQIILFIVFEMVFMGFLSFVLVYYGPFEKTRENLVTTAMTTMKHQYIATWFLSKEEIDKIMAKYRVVSYEDEVESDIIIKNTNQNNVQLIDIKNNRFTGKMLIVANPKHVALGITDMLGERGRTLSEIVKKNGAIGGINAGGFGDENRVGTGAVPLGIVVQNHVIKYKAGDTFDIIGFDDKDVLVIDNNVTIEEIQKKGIRDAISFGPPLVINGKPTISYGNGGWGIQPRSAIGQRKDGTVLLLTIDGRQIHSVGASLKEVQNLFLQYDAYNAANLDGGSSATMVYEGAVVNRPSDILGERSIPSAFIIK